MKVRAWVMLNRFRDADRIANRHAIYIPGVGPDRTDYIGLEFNELRHEI